MLLRTHGTMRRTGLLGNGAIGTPEPMRGPYGPYPTIGTGGPHMTTSQDERGKAFRALHHAPGRLRHRQCLGRRLGAHDGGAGVRGAGDLVRGLGRHRSGGATARSRATRRWRRRG